MVSSLDPSKSEVDVPIVRCDTCDCYQRFAHNHSACNFVDLDACGPDTKPCMTKEDKQYIVDLHNKYRSRIAMGQANTYHRQPAAADMMKLVCIAQIFMIFIDCSTS